MDRTVLFRKPIRGASWSRERIKVCLVSFFLFELIKRTGSVERVLTAMEGKLVKR